MQFIPCIFAVISSSKAKPNKLHWGIKYVSQARNNLIADVGGEEIYKLVTNNSRTKAKNADVVTYRMSTGLAVMGLLHLTDTERLERRPLGASMEARI